ncbi:mechanosensitive ion channel family protein [Falsiruegeria mediterranea]|uniref:Moderate conductance mechanosensitive channel YbiO n=1 Tax=Falsiruegeria mediterranea M17 TaxID=1200281 RepID=A0A2R8C8D8_9RHOB|nr:mechanosensitive ion channel domain-containing protein [Falsiruegeria mediterranea]SPJ28700.1 Moderate conductance mechanosensitive channel YbiO [Falsiruegeria mediterranea M17]
MVYLFRLLAVLVFTSVLAVPLHAQVPVSTSSGSTTSSSAPVVPEDLSPDQVDDLVARMSDDQVRALLLERLDAVAEQQTQAAPEKSILTVIRELGTNMVLGWVHVLQQVPNLVSGQLQAFANFAASFGSGEMVAMFGYILAALLAGYGAEKLVVWLVLRRARAETGQEADNLWSTVGFLFRRFCRELLGLVVFYVVLRFVGTQLLSAEELTFAAPLVFYLIWIPRLGAAISRFVLAPNRADLRLVNVSDKWAKYLHRNLIGLFLLGGFTIFIVGFNQANGVPMGETRLGFWLNTSVHIYIGIIAWRAREGLSDMMRGTDPDRSRFDEAVAKAYPFMAIGVSFVMWLVVEMIIGSGDRRLLMLLGTAPHYTTMFWLLMAPAIDTLIRGLVRHLAPPMMGDGPIAERAYKSTKRSYIRIGRVLAGIFVILQIANVWEIDLRNVAAAGVGHDVAGALVEFLMIVAIGYILNEVVSLWINRRLAAEMTASEQSPDEEAGEGGGAGGSRLATVLPLLRVSAQVAISVIFGLLAIGALGVDITPLLAGAGILGLAIGFGAQKLVADIVGGIFFLIDDAFRVGEYVDVGGTMGTVEKISIRSMQLRHHRGAVHTIPYGEIQKLTNFSRDWVIMKLKFTVPFDTDPNKVKKIFKKIGAEMMQDEVHKDGFLQPFKSQGVFDFDDVGMIIRGKFMAKPGKQFTLRKEIFNRVKTSFNEAGIDFARREVRVAIPGMEDHDNMTDEQKTAVAAAASEASNQQGQAAPPADDR